ncbi:hypothetical protein CDD82_7707 [Ophiocordyceps australis]|uniref:Uncharacterized protein n=1 Tax=Ophiocordyceps australis TaxID=1399860 RepID=A0A2C5YJ28_9HYPO|nr:hypothetical protein CDD82_7707 [Ophiocordyceps australis]
MKEDIAVVGIGLRFPGEATSPSELWKVVSQGQSQWSEFPKDRLNIDGYFHPGGDRQGSISFRGAHFLKGDVAAFDSPFFSIAAEDAKAIDPQQRMLLEVSYEALENAGIRKEDIDGSDASVYVGSFVKDYEQICLRDPDWQPQYAATGNGIAIMANRISHFFNLHGPSMTLDTGCSGSLVSIHLAAQSLASGESSMALAAGSGLILTPNTIMPMTALNFLSPDGRCFTFDSRANGYGRGEGIGVVVMKRLSDALRDNDTIRAVIRATAVNQDGRTPGITLPSKEAQVANIKAVYAAAKLGFEQTAYVECHGTGTQAGDWRELKAISETIGSVRSRERPVVVGSVKPNIGHLEGAAGVAGLIKAVLVLEHGQIPPNINYKEPNPSIDFEEWRVQVPTSLMEWPVAGRRRVSVNCFGFGGTNAHVILDEAPGHLFANNLFGHHSSVTANVNMMPGSGARPRGPHLVCYSSHEKSGVRRVMESHVAHFKRVQHSDDVCSSRYLRDYAYTVNCRRSQLEWRGYVVASSTEAIAASVEAMTGSIARAAGSSAQPRVGFVFCGQGAQWAQMGKELFQYGVFARAVVEASLYLSVELEAPYSLVSELSRAAGQSRVGEAHIAQPATTVVQMALVDLLASLGIAPAAVVGHSSGEIAAAYAAGALGRKQAWATAYYRGLAAARLRGRGGAMMVVGLAADETRRLLAPWTGRVQVACINSPRSTTISGDGDGINELERMLGGRDVFCRRLPVSVAYHSHHVEAVQHEYQTWLADSKPRAARGVTMVSSVTGQAVAGPELTARYWARNMVSAVDYVAAVEAMMRLPQRPTVLVELSPRAALRSPTRDIIQNMDNMENKMPEYRSILDAHSPAPAALLRLVGRLWTLGLDLRLDALLDVPACGPPKCLTDLPSYAWNHSKTYWHESHLSLANRFRRFGRHDLLGAPTADSTPLEPRWRGFLRVAENPWIQDHQVQKTTVYPAAGMVAMVLEAARQMAADRPVPVVGYQVTNLAIAKALIVPGSAHGLEVALNVNTTSPDAAAFAIYSKPLGRDWERNAHGGLVFASASPAHAAWFDALDAQHRRLDARCCVPVSPRQLYELLDTMGINYGPLFQNMTALRTPPSGPAVVAAVRVPDTRAKMPAGFEYDHVIHPATLDAVFQTLFAIDAAPRVPVFVKSIYVSANAMLARAGLVLSGFATAATTGIGHADADIAMATPAGARVVVQGLHLARLDAAGFLPNHASLCSHIVWKHDAARFCAATLTAQLDLLAHKWPALTVLQVGGGTATTSAALAVLCPDAAVAPRLARYTIVDVAQSLALVKDSVLEPYVEVKQTLAQVSGQYHVVLYFAHAHVDDDVAGLDKHVRPGGMLLEEVQSSSAQQQQESSSSPGPQCRHDQDSGHGATLVRVDFHPDSEPQVCMAPRRKTLLKSNDKRPSPLPLLLLLPPGPRAKNDQLTLFTRHFKRAALKSLPNLVVSPISPDMVRHDPALLHGNLVLSLLDVVDPAHCVFNWSQHDFDLFALVHKAAKTLVWLTQGAHLVPVAPEAAPMLALARTLMSEDPLKTIVSLDLAPDSRLRRRCTVAAIWSVVEASLLSPASLPRETEFAEQDGRLLVPRLVPLAPLNRLIEHDKPGAHVAQLPFRPAADSSLRLTIAKPGIPDGLLYFASHPDPDLPPTHVQIVFERALLSHLAVDTALGRTTADHLGLDVVGTIVQVGSAVDSLRPGLRVAALAPNGTVANVVTTHASLVSAVRPDAMRSIPLPAAYALVHVGRVAPGRRVLVQAGASAYGQPAVELALGLGADVYATVFGPDASRQRKTLLACGLAPQRIIDADAPGLVHALAAATDGHGLDLVFNPTQCHVQPAIDCLRPCGTAFHFASRSPSAPLRPVMPSSASLINFDLPELLRHDVPFVATLMADTNRLILDKLLATSILSTVNNLDFAMDSIHDALLHVHHSPHLGYAWLNADNPHLEVPVLDTIPTKPLHEALDPAATYLLAGGLGGLGRSISDLLIANGVKHLAYLSRSGPDSPKAAAFLASLTHRGIHARAYAVDLCNPKLLTDTIRGPMAAQMPPIKGVFQCAAVIKDAVFDNMTFADWNAAVLPKTHGTHNLVQAVPTDSDPFFVFLASSAGVIGNRGQANYAAGNCFLDALSHKLRLDGRRAVSIDLGPVLGAGMLAEDDDILTILRASGFYGIRHQDFLHVITHAITMEAAPGIDMPPQVALGVGTGGLIRQNNPADPYWSRTALYQYLNLVDMPAPDLTLDDSVASSPSVHLKTTLAACTDKSEAVQIIQAALVNMLAKAMTMLPEELDPNKPPNAYGVDSLVAVGVRNFVINTFAVQLSVFEVLSDATIAELSGSIADKGSYGNHTEGL